MGWYGAVFGIGNMDRGYWDTMGMAMGMGHLAAAGFVNLLAICCSWPAKLMPN